MKKMSFFGVLVASAALAACGGGDDAETDTADAAGADSAATETAAADTADTGMDMGGDAPAEDAAPAEEPAMADEGMSDDAMADEAPAEDAAADEGATDQAAAGDGAVMVAGLTGDAAAGRRVWTRCASCHVLEEGVNRVGPSLYGIFGRETGSVEGFRYSDANANANITWDAETMFAYLENPREYIPGTIMAFPGLRSEQDRADVIAYMKENGGLGDAG
ncbi:MAG: cytochrome c family protein [Oceanicaulis sp.]